MTLDELKRGNDLYEQITKLEKFIIAQSKVATIYLIGDTMKDPYTLSGILKDHVMGILHNNLDEIKEELTELGTNK